MRIPANRSRPQKKVLRYRALKKECAGALPNTLVINAERVRDARFFDARTVDGVYKLFMVDHVVSGKWFTTDFNSDEECIPWNLVKEIRNLQGDHTVVSLVLSGTCALGGHANVGRLYFRRVAMFGSRV